MLNDAQLLGHLVLRMWDGGESLSIRTVVLFRSICVSTGRSTPAGIQVCVLHHLSYVIRGFFYMQIQVHKSMQVGQ